MHTYIIEHDYPDGTTDFTTVYSTWAYAIHLAGEMGAYYPTHIYDTNGYRTSIYGHSAK